MRQVREVLRLKYECKESARAIARSIGSVGRTAVTDYLGRFEASGLSWPLPADLDDEALEARLFPPPPPGATRVVPDFARMDVELRRKGVTLQLLWTEYRAEHQEAGFQFSRYCELYGQWKKRQRLWMRQPHKAGEKLFVDFSGDGLEVVEPRTGEVAPVKLFVAAMGASSYTFAYAVADETLRSFVECNVRALEFLQGAPQAVVVDNLKAAVTRADRYEPAYNEAFAEFGRHYGLAVIATRPYRPRDKAKVEVAVQVAQRWILAVLRHRTFYSLADLNDAIAELVERLNARKMRHLGRSRRELFEELDAPALKALPQSRHEHAAYKWARVGPNYHVEFEHHSYSVPHIHRGAEVLVRATERAVEILRAGVRIAAHQRSRRAHHYTTLKEHMPPHHLHVADSTVEQLRVRARQVGPATAQMLEEMVTRRAHPEHAIKGILGILALTRGHGVERVEAACARGLHFKAFGYQAVKNILARGLDALALQDEAPHVSLPLHEHIRGKEYFH